VKVVGAGSVADAAEGDVGLERLVGFETEGLEVVGDGGGKGTEGVDVAFKSEPEDAWAVEVGEGACVAQGEDEGVGL
jgi:hypothetical protein